MYWNPEMPEDFILCFIMLLKHEYKEETLQLQPLKLVYLHSWNDKRISEVISSGMNKGAL